MSSPRAPRFAFLDHPGPLAFAHRGGAAESPENTWQAFGHAIDDLGYRYVETDVHATADGVAVILHDAVLDRVTDRRGAVDALPWSEVARARAADGEGVPRLTEVLAAWPEVRWNIDAKHDAVVEPLVRVLRGTGAMDRVCVTAFSDRRLAQVRRAAGPALCTAMGPGAVTGLRLASLAPALVPARSWGGAGAVQVPLRHGPIPVVDPRLLAAAHGYDLAVHAWTIDDAATMDRLIDLGVDGIMTDRPAVLREVLARRRLWV